MQQLHGLSLGQKHVVILEIQCFLIRKALSFRNPDGTRMENHGVLLIDGKPVFYLGTKVGIQYLRVFDKYPDCSSRPFPPAHKADQSGTW